MKKTPCRIKPTLFNNERFKKLTRPEQVVFLSILMDPRLSKKGEMQRENKIIHVRDPYLDYIIWEEGA